MDRLSAHLDRGWALITRGETTGALLAARQALDLDESSPEAHNLLGYIYSIEGDFEEALSCYNRAIDLDEWYLDPILNAADLLTRCEYDATEAIRLSRMASNIASSAEEIAEAVLLEVEALISLERIEEARQRLEEIQDPAGLPSHYTISVGRALLEVGDLQAAKHLIERSCEQDPSNPDGWYCHGLIAREEGKRIEAVKAFLTAHKLDLISPDPAWIEQLEPMERVSKNAIASLSEAERKMLAGTTVIVEPAPSERQICREIDPRLIAFGESIDASKGAFEKLWIFTKNLARACVFPSDVEEELVHAIRHELGSI